MQLRDVAGMAANAESIGTGARIIHLHPDKLSDGLLAVDLWELEPDGATPLHSHAEEHVLFVLSGSGELAGSDRDGATIRVRPDSLVNIAPHEAHTLRNTGGERLRVLVSTPLLVRSNRALGIVVPASPAQEKAGAPPPTPEAAEAERTDLRRSVLTGNNIPPKSMIAESQPAPMPATGDEAAEPVPDISGLMKRASELPVGPRPERRKPAPEPEPISQADQVDQAQEAEEEEEGQSNLMELLVVFDGGSRGNPGQGYGSYMVQSPGRKPVIKRVEFGDNYTNNQAEYDTLIACLRYIVERLTTTGRSPQQTALDIKSDSDLLVNQVNGQYKVKDAGLRTRHTQVMDLLEQFGAWIITWHPREESVRLLGH